jgi:hypothetical protein
MAAHGEVLIAIMNRRADWAIAQEQHWYRIPWEQVEKLKQRHQWLPPQWLAFYQTKVFEQEAHLVGTMQPWRPFEKSSGGNYCQPKHSMLRAKTVITS